MKAVIYSKPNCPACVMAKNLMKSRGVAFEEKTLGVDCTREDIEAAVGGPVHAVPQIFVDGNYIGTYRELDVFFRRLTVPRV